MLLLALVISTALPEIVTIIPLYQVLRDLRLLDSILGLTLIMSSVLAPFTVWVLVAFIRQVPYEIEEAAIIDGARLPEIIWRIVLADDGAGPGDDGRHQLRQRLEQPPLPAGLLVVAAVEDAERRHHRDLPGPVALTADRGS